SGGKTLQLKIVRIAVSLHSNPNSCSETFSCISTWSEAVCMAWNTDVSADGKPHSLWKKGRALASQPESVTKTNIAENRIHRSDVNARRQKPLSVQCCGQVILATVLQ
ncbi:hypothetical protein, partial [Escherichia coli]